MKIILISLFLSISFFGISQKKYLKFAHLTIEEGLPSNTINDILKDKDGLIWVASEDGVSNFNGYGFSTFRHQNTHKNPDF